MAKRLNVAGIDRMTATDIPVPPRPTTPAPAGAAALAATEATPAPAPAPAAPAVGLSEADMGAPAPAAPRPAFAGAQVVSEADVYHPGGEYSFVRDAFHANVDRDVDAAGRLSRWRAQIAETFAVATRSGFNDVIPPGYRGEMLVAAIDPGRPIVSRLTNRVTLTDATPFRIPVEGEFTGVGDHVEGTAHVAEGTVGTDEVTVTPGAVSGAFRVSRELVDASNPALDTLALNAMLRDYRSLTEDKAYYLLDGGATPTAGVADMDALLDSYLAFLDDRGTDGVHLASSAAAYGEYSKLSDTTGRPLLPYLNPGNAQGTNRGGLSGLSLQGTEVFRSGKVAANESVWFRSEDVLWCESSVLTFRFDEVEGPGVIKLALWAYAAAAKLRPVASKPITTVAA